VKNDLKFTAYLPVFFRAKRVDVKHVDHHDVKHVDVKHVDVKHVDGKHRGPYPLLSRVPVFSFIVEHRCIITGPFRAGQIRCPQVRQVLPPIFQYIIMFLIVIVITNKCNIDTSTYIFGSKQSMILCNLTASV